MDGGTALQTNWRDAASDSHNNGWTAWNHDLLQFLIDHEWHGSMALVIAVGETLIGIALILGLMTGLAAFGGEVMAGSAVLAGGATVNPLLFAIATLLVLAWKTGGWIGLDRWVLPLLDRPQSGIRAPVRADPVMETAKPVNVTR